MSRGRGWVRALVAALGASSGPDPGLTIRPSVKKSRIETSATYAWRTPPC